ncbi:FAD/NAD(P)-binding domain-containing protein [Cucurbitaria berberidis CBS 394.84]|uniref:FAD/NAD(P)-binding domain-containing protein n=1 Tax=Cucurbitaria berberidis CBS 394.84 TaxID=1168544 RepID=A0A9P4GI25_9PLEO|nr:FAD/NAD(P)-binding domain-containing protein [Cucurbitaria berberidis CBS 394.84]KAF1845985.1 FAD/NAD(P)-binding domain-containing protein [Cucurbitaria berberidis CBS 394.84]
MASEDFNIAIVGAGIGGLGFAIGLNHLNVPFTIYESAPQFSAVGAGVGLGPNALRAMDMIDKRFSAMYMAIATGNLKPEKKHVMMEAMRMEEGLGEGESWWGHGGWGAEYYERTGAHRKDLLDIMTSFIKKDAVRFNKRVKGMNQVDGRVTLTFEDGSVAEHAAVVGCDGVKGFSRRMVLEDRYPECVEPQYTNKYVYRAIIPMSDAKEILGDLATDAKMYMSKGANLSTYPISEGKQINMVAFKRDTQPWTHPDFTYDVSREDMLKDFQSCNPDARLMKLLDWAKPTRWAITHHLNTPTYYNSLICMLGDVAHAGGPHQGAGAGQCLEDSLVLSRVLGKLYHSTPFFTLASPSPLRTTIIEAAFQAYDEVRRPRAQEQVRTSQQCGEIYNLMDPVAGDDIPKVLASLHGRFGWIWLHDLASDVRQVEERFEELAGVRNEVKEESVRFDTPNASPVRNAVVS